MANPSFVWVLLSLGLVHANSVTPVQKVTDLLERLAKVIVQEGQAEASAYDKYACFCKQESDDKLYAIENSQALEAKLGVKIGKLSTEIAALDGEISDLGGEIQRLTGEIEAAERARATAHDTFLTNLENAEAAIDAVARAIEALEGSKSELSGKVELEASSLAQLRSAASLALASSMSEGLPAQTLVQLRALNGQPGVAYSYKYHSNEIIETLETLLDTFKRRKSSLEKEEFAAKTAHELKVQDLSNQRKFARKEKAEKEEVREAKAEEKEQTEADKTQEENERIADQNFLRVLQGDCEQKAKFWDQRSQTRQEELTAIGNAVDALKTGVAPNWKANKRLVGLQRRAVIKGHWEFVADAPAPSFLQLWGQNLRGSTDAHRAQSMAIEKAQRVLAQAASSLNSQVLSMAALKVQSSQDYFVKVRQIIKDLMATLEADAANEMTEKQFCDTQIGNAVNTRDEEQSKVESLTTDISGKTARMQQLVHEIAELSRQIAQNQDALRQKTELRLAEQKENTQTVNEAGAGKEAVQQAIAFLRDFYNPVLLQYEPWVATDSDREGKTVRDKAPQVFDENYHGAQEAATGIIGILEVILADFDRTGTTVTSQESASVSAFDTFKSTNEADTASKQSDIDTKDDDVTGLNSTLLTLKDNLKEAEENHRNAVTELSTLHARCIEGVETYEERVANRNREIEALKEAHDILESWS